jgi:hypothetical protein
MEYQELKYLRDELNTMCHSYSEQGNKTINMVLVIWGAAFIFLGKDGIKLSGIGFEDIPLYFAVATILFISNLVIYYTALKFYNNIDSICTLAAYIAVFYEKRPSNTVKVGDNISWELTKFENMANERNVKNIYHKDNNEYAALTCVSIVLMFIFWVLLVINIFTPKASGVELAACIVVSLIYVICLVISILWLWQIPEYTYARDNLGMRAKQLKEFINYAIKTGHDTEESLKNRLGDIWDIVMNKTEQDGK